MDLLLRPLTIADEADAWAAQAELAADGFEFLLDDTTLPWPAYVARLVEIARGERLDPGRVPAAFLVAVVGGEIVGRTSVRFALTPWLADVGGHIGYGVRPAFRRRGYATEILRRSLEVAATAGVESALVTCDDDNVGSATVIERCGGVLQDVRTFPDAPAKRRYWAPTT